MQTPRATSAANRTQVVIVTTDAEFERSARATFGASAQIDLQVTAQAITTLDDAFECGAAAVLVVDLGPAGDAELTALARLTLRNNGKPPVVAITQAFDAGVARTLLQMRVADFLVKPVAPVELVRACARVAKGDADANGPTEAQIYTYLPAVGGAGVTTIAIQTALLLLNSAGPRAKPRTCLVDLDFQHGAVADYLDLEPRLNLAEIEPRPDRLDRQLLEVMLSHHSSGLAVIAAPNSPAEMRTFDPEMVTRLLDLVSSHFEYVVFDMPRTWFSWTDSVLLGSNKLFIVSETTVPALRHAKHLVAAIKERLGDGPQPQVIVNRFEQRMFATGLRRSDLEQALGDSFCASIPNDYALVREAIDRGVPLDEVKAGNKISQQLKKLILAQTSSKAAPAKAVPLLQKLKLASAR
ncbi:MAG TPA: response regulator receiver protein [Pseudolabrys sp.]|nr:response regulator receiver protein [Pseudolabrys sp.]